MKLCDLIFFSFGQSAVFLLGGLRIDEKPTAMLIRSGDIVVMSGVSRLCYHGIPRILSADKMPWNDVDSESECPQRRRCDCLATCDAEDSGKETTLALFPSCLSSEIIRSCMQDCFWEPFGNYLRTSRINLNVRQVLHPGVKSLHSSDVL
jgi:alkylated DNA repair protein alkB family protein 1